MITKKLGRRQFLKYVRTVGMTTMRGRGFYYPVDSAMSSDGRIYVLNRSFERATLDTIRVTMLNEDGEYFGVFGSGGIGDGEFRWPCGIAIDNQNRIYVTDEQLHRVSVFTESGDFLRHWGSKGTSEGELDGPAGIVFDQENNVLITDSRNHRVQKFTNDGEFILAFGKHGSGKGDLNLPWGLTVSHDSDVYVADWGNDRIQRFSSDGKFVAHYGSSGRQEGEFTRPAGVIVNQEGYICVADWGNERVQVLGPDGEFIQKIRGQATNSEWANDFLGVNVEEAGARERADLEPDIDYFNDDPHEESSHIEKLLWGPVSLILDAEERLFITETNRHRIQVYERNN
jgi:DNA-binding beta-propeller fold protein YncE